MTAPQPLAGLRVVEFTHMVMGPTCGMVLADLGADVLRVDRMQPSGLGIDRAPRFDLLNRGKRTVSVDLKSPEGVAFALRIVACSDALVEGFRPGTMERLGLGPEPCLAQQPKLVYGRVTGFGQTGPLAPAAGHDLNYIALTGALHAIGPAGGAPLPPLNLVGDYGGGALYLAFGVMAAVFEKQRSGRGQVVDAAMVDGAASLMSLFYGLNAAGRWDGPRGENLLDGGAPFYGAYETSDGRHVAVGPLEPKFFAEFAQRIGLAEHFVKRQYDRSTWPAMREAIAEILRSRTRDEWCAVLEGTDACFAPVLSMAEAPTHAHAAARGAFVEIEGVVQPAPAPRFDRSVPDTPRPNRENGADTDTVLAEAGFSADDIAALRREGVIA